MACEGNALWERVIEALLAYRERNGPDKAIALLEEELARERVLKRLSDERKFAAEAEAQRAGLDKAVEALEFYANDEHYIAFTSPSAVQEDAGKIARLALADMSGD